MKVKGKIKLKMKYNLIPMESKLIMIISFKNPFKLLHQIPKKIKIPLTSNFLQEEGFFLEKSEEWLNDEKGLIGVAEKAIKGYFKQYDERNRFVNILKKVKDINNKNIEVEVDLKPVTKGE